MNDQQTRDALGALLKEVRLAQAATQQEMAKQCGVDIRTWQVLERGEKLPREMNLAKIEKGIGWRVGSIMEIWRDRDHIPASSVTLAEMTHGSTEASWTDLEAEAAGGPVLRASQLTDEELAAELTYRLRNYKNRVMGES